MTQYCLRFLLLVSLAVGMSACVTTSNSSLTDKADPNVAVERYVQLGLEYIRRNDLHRARKHLTRALEIDPDSAQANGVMGLVYAQEGEADKAEELYQKALALDENYTLGRSYYGAFLFSAERYADALEQFKKASLDTKYEGRAQVFSNMALCHMKLGQNEQAIEAYFQTLRLDRSNGRALSGITELLIQQGRYDKAQQYYNRLIRLIRDQGLKHSAQSLWQGIRIATHYGSHAQADALNSMLLELFPESEEALESARFSRRGGK